MTMDHTQQALVSIQNWSHHLLRHADLCQAFESSNPPRYLANNGYLQQPVSTSFYWSLLVVLCIRLFSG